MFGDMMGKLKEAQKKVEETKARLHTVLIDETSTDNKLKVTITANRTIKSITIITNYSRTRTCSRTTSS